MKPRKESSFGRQGERQRVEEDRLCVGRCRGSSKLVKAQELDVAILDEAGLMKLLEEKL